MIRSQKRADIVAEMVANVIAVAVATGDKVEAGGILLDVKVRAGDVVQEGDILAVVA